ncbi:lipopolysaccharide biosynthesis protein [Winogradskyella costae]|uniref:lipopolysaccharide biosynthesis protein n=1 Tax=Winogradskyella costae TaxID=2697008 RepID=UPI0015CC3891|nr:sugar transporter [Winogradskyella costae]
MSRVSKSIKNAKVGAFFFILSIFVQFFSRKIFLDFLGDEFIGLTSTLRSILGFLNLAELGIGTAIGYALYRPVFDKNHIEINKVIALLGVMYKKIGFFIFGAGVLISLFFPFWFDDVDFSLGLVYFVFLSFLTSTLLSYFINYHMTLLEADQKGYVVQIYFQSLNILRLLLQAALAYYLQSYYAWIIMEVIFSTFFSIILRIKVKQEYPWLIIKSKETANIIKSYPDVIKKVKQLFIHKMGAFVKDGTDNILVFILVSLESVAYFGNYMLIFNQLTSLVKITFAGTGAGIGNLVAENNKKNISKVFWEMMALQFFIAGFLSLAIYYLISPFVVLWLEDEKYILDKAIILLMIANFFISIVRSPVQHFQNAYGLFSDTWAPAVEILINLVISFICGKIWGIFGIMLGTFTSLSIIVIFWKPYFLYSKGFNISVWQYWKRFIPLMTVFIISAFAVDFIFIEFINQTATNIFQWCLNGILLSLVILFVYGLSMYIISKGFRDFCIRASKLILNKIEKT